MVINFNVGDFLVINHAFGENVLPAIDCLCNRQTIISLGYIGANPSEVLATGTVPPFANELIKSFIRVQPVNDTTNPMYRINESTGEDVGTAIYFCSDAHLNNSFELSNAYIDDKCHIKCLNSTGSTITKGSLVRQISFDTTQQLPTIGLASASAVGTSAVLGLASADILTTEVGSIIISGSFCGLNTSSFSAIGDKVFLGNTGGTISTAAGTVETIVGRILSIDATVGCLSLVESLGGAGGGGFFSDGIGTNAAIGKGTIAPTAAGENALAQGDNCVASANNSFAQGDACIASGESSFAQGRGNTASLPGTFVQGINNYDNYSGPSTGYGYNFIQGRNNYLYNEYKNDFVQGEGNVLYGEFNSTYYGGNFVQGKNNRAEYATYSFLQGYNNQIDEAARVFAQGQAAFVDQSDKKTWGSNRNVLGGAQSSRLIRHVTTTNATTTNIASIRRQFPSNASSGAVTYGFRAVIVGRNTTTTADNVIYTLDRALAFVPTPTAVTLNGTPTFVQEATGGATATAAIIIASSSSILFRVTGVAGQTYQWVIDVHFLEVTA